MISGLVLSSGVIAAPALAEAPAAVAAHPAHRDSAGPAKTSSRLTAGHSLSAGQKRVSERYLYYKYGVTMGISTNGDQVAAHYAAKYPRCSRSSATAPRTRRPGRATC